MNHCAYELALEITADDIARGKRKTREKCPIALAFKRYFPDHLPLVYFFRTDVISGKNIYTKNPEFYVKLKNCPDTEEFIQALDSHEPVEPCTVHFLLSVTS